jgi:transposase
VESWAGRKFLPVRSAGATADWLKQYPDIEMISRDRCGSFAQGAYEGAPQARQVAGRFHILQNLREAIQAQLSRAAGSSARPLLPPEGNSRACRSSGPALPYMARLRVLRRLI